MQGVFHAVGQDYESQGPARGLRLAVLDSGSEVLEVSAHGHSNTLWARTTTSGIPPVVSNSPHSTEAAKVQAVHAQSLSNTMYAMAARGALARGVGSSTRCAARMQRRCQTSTRRASPTRCTLWSRSAGSCPKSFDSLNYTEAAKAQDVNAHGFPHTLYAVAAFGKVSLEVFDMLSYADAVMVQDVNAQGLSDTLCAMAELGKFRSRPSTDCPVRSGPWL